MSSLSLSFMNLNRVTAWRITAFTNLNLCPLFTRDSVNVSMIFTSSSVSKCSLTFPSLLIKSCRRLEKIVCLESAVPIWITSPLAIGFEKKVNSTSLSCLTRVWKSSVGSNPDSKSDSDSTVKLMPSITSLNDFSISDLVLSSYDSPSAALWE